MTNVRLPKALCVVVGEVLSETGTHSSLEILFRSSGAGEPGPEILDLAHHSKWKEWLFKAGRDPDIDSLDVLGGVIEEFMDVPPNEFSDEWPQWQGNRQRLERALEEAGYRYFRGGRVLPLGTGAADHPDTTATGSNPQVKPGDVSELLEVLIRGLRRAMHPLTHRRKGAQKLQFSNEYDVQDLLHALLRPWVADIRPEEYTPSYAGSSTRMDFLLPGYGIVIEMKFVRDRSHGKEIGEELQIDIGHYRKHPGCRELWCVIYDPESLLTNSQGLVSDLKGEHSQSGDTVLVKVLVV